MTKTKQPETWLEECQRKRLYTGAELRPFDSRPGAMDAYALPSVVAGVRTPRTLPICAPTTNRV